jgi:hypothetical protein
VLDLLADADPDVDGISLYASPKQDVGGEAMFLGLALRTGLTWDVEPDDWRRFEAGDYAVLLLPLPPGTFEVVAFAHRPNGGPVKVGARAMTGR